MSVPAGPVRKGGGFFNALFDFNFRNYVTIIYIFFLVSAERAVVARGWCLGSGGDEVATVGFAAGAGCPHAGRIRVGVGC